MGERLTIGLNIDPAVTSLATALRLAEFADNADYDIIGIQDHPYQPAFFETWTLITALATRTKRISFTPNVANMGLRLPSMLMKSASSLQILTDGRFVLGVGGGASINAIKRYGGMHFESTGELVSAFEEALIIFKRLQESSRVPIIYEGEHHNLNGAIPGPIPPTPVPIWIGASQPRVLGLTGKYADGWICPLNIYVAPDEVPQRQQTIDDAATAANRDPRSVRRMYNLVGTITPNGAGVEEPKKPLEGSVSFWVDRLGYYASELGFDGFFFWAAQDHEAQAELFASQVIPQLR